MLHIDYKVGEFASKVNYAERNWDIKDELYNVDLFKRNRRITAAETNRSGLGRIRNPVRNYI